MSCWLRTKNNFFEIRHNGYALLFLVAALFSFVIILEIIDLVVHSFKANWFMYIGLLAFCVLLSFPVLFTTLKIKVRKDEIMVIKTCGIRFKITTDEIKKITIIKPDTVDQKTNIVTRIKVYAGIRRFYVDSKMKNYDKFLNFITENVDSHIIDYKINWLTKSRTPKL